MSTSCTKSRPLSLVASRNNVTDLMTKILSPEAHERLSKKLLHAKDIIGSTILPSQDPEDYNNYHRSRHL